MKPYRLLSSQELEQIRAQFEDAFLDWNTRYARIPLTFSLQKTGLSLSIHNPVALSTYGLVEKDIFSCISMNVFGESHVSFEPVSRYLAAALFESLFKHENIEIMDTPKPVDWLYKGSTCLLLEILFENTCVPCLLSPEWVHAQLSPSLKNVKAPLTSLNEALKEQVIPLEVALNPIRLPLKQILNLQKGDLIKTDQNLNDALCLIQGNTDLAQVQLRQNKNHKSILIRSFT